MKTLMLLRHAKSSWKHHGLSDHDRPLNKRGKQDAPKMGRFLCKKGLLPDIIISSTAKRAKNTAKKLIQASGFTGPCKHTRMLYDSDTDTYISLLKKLPEKTQSVMLIGHNPAHEEFVESVTGLSERLPTAAIALIKLPINKWKDLGPDIRGKLKNVWRPKDLG